MMENAVLQSGWKAWRLGAKTFEDFLKSMVKNSRDSVHHR